MFFLSIVLVVLALLLVERCYEGDPKLQRCHSLNAKSSNPEAQKLESLQRPQVDAPKHDHAALSD